MNAVEVVEGTKVVVVMVMVAVILIRVCGKYGENGEEVRMGSRARRGKWIGLMCVANLVA